MNIGIDLDNTIIQYDSSFLKAAKFLKVEIPEEILEKEELKKFIRSSKGGELLWQKVQGLAYGKFAIGFAQLYPGVKRFLWRSKYRNHTVKIISHKTIYGNFDSEQYLLRDTAEKFLQLNNIFDCEEPLVEGLFFLSSREEKIQKIIQENSEIFIDDLIEVVDELAKYDSIKVIHFERSKKEIFSDSKVLKKSDWHQIDNLINNSWEDLEVIVLVKKLMKCQITDVEKIAIGRNSAVYKLATADQGLLKLKIYPIDEGHDRLKSEYFSNQIINDYNFNCISKPIAIDESLSVALYQWIEGDLIQKFELEDITECANFIGELNKIKGDSRFESIGTASAACLSGRDIENQLMNRLVEFKKVDNHELRKFLNEEFTPFVNQHVSDVKKEWSFDYSYEEDLKKEQLTLSPSDFGFHNMIKTGDGKLNYIDFEYFGFDDPVKLMSDFYYHPGMNLNSKQKEHWILEISRHFSEEILQRFNLFKSLYGLIWCLIILNEFRSEIWERRNLANPDKEREKSFLLKGQLNKAIELFNSIKIESNH